MTVASPINSRIEAAYASAHWLLPDEDTVELFTHADYSASRVDDPAICSQIPTGKGSYVICFEVPSIPAEVAGLVERVERLTLRPPWRNVGEAIGWTGDVLDAHSIQRLKTVLADCILDVGDDEPEVADPFPTFALPRLVRDMVEHGARAQCVDVGFWAVPALPILAGCIGNSRSVRIKRTWLEPSVLFAAIIGTSGIGKSASMRELAKPVRDRDRVLAEYNRDAQDAYRSDCAAAREAKEPPPEPPPILSIVLDDSTMEAIAARLADNARGMLLVNDELAGWLKSMNRYRSGDDNEKWLRINGADSLKVDRKGSGGSVRQQYIPRAAVSVVGGMQPRIAARHLTGEAIESGAAARILIARPPSQPAVWTDDDIPESVGDGWRRLCESLLDLSHDPDEPKAVALSADARKLFVAYHDANGRACHVATESGDNARAAVLSKLRGYAARLALIFELAKAAEHGAAELVTSIGSDAMASGIAVVDWFAGEAVKLYREFAGSTPDAEQRLDGRILTILRTGGQMSEGAIRDALNRHPSSDDVRASLRRLEQAGHIQFAGVEPTGGRPRRLWKVSQ